MKGNPTPMKAQFLPLFNVNLSRLQLNSTSTQFQLNFNSTSSQPYFNLSLKSTAASLSFSTQLNLNLNLNSIWLWLKSNPILSINWMIMIETKELKQLDLGGIEGLRMDRWPKDFPNCFISMASILLGFWFRNYFQGLIVF